MHRSEVWWADVPGDKRRPVLIVTRERFIPRLAALVVAPLTTTVRSIPTEVVLDPADGLAQACAANFDNVFTLSKKRFVEHITTLSDERLADVCGAYRFATGC
ncbi:MAG: type II toxin-antitoxin system PemK/MazF family toxin [Acidimicrobiia bacterium]|nr:type II toxin-antitoxin system PemK/MazF family toxin [Acidimicrobiia bacterium]